jgi:hypothetical protein
VASVEELIRPLAPRAEAEIRPRLGGFLGAMLRHYLPQVWVFRTEQGVASLRVAEDGRATVAAGADAGADVTIEIGHGLLERVLAGGARSPGGSPPKVTTHSAKGRAAFDYLRSRIGL